MSSAKATFVLIHGGGSSAWDWHLVAPRLRNRGHEVVAIDLPIEDSAMGISEYADAVVDAAGDRDDLAVVGHSFGALTAPVVCARSRARLLVLLAPMIPRPGESFNRWWRDTGHDALDIPMDSRQQMVDTFYHDVDPVLATEAIAHGRAQAFSQGDRPWPLDSWPQVPTRVLLCRQDRMFPLEFQREVARRRLGIVPDEMAGGHSVFLSRPAELARRLDDYWTALPD